MNTICNCYMHTGSQLINKRKWGMVMGLISGLVVTVIVVALLIAVVGMYNGLIKARQRVRNAWSQIDVQLQRRFDMIPNLVETLKGYMKHEEETLIRVTELRTAWHESDTVTKKAQLGNELGNVLNKLLAVSEGYPELKANENFVELQREIKETENKIAFSRQFYNDTVTIYNTKLEVFPSNIIAGMFHFKPESLLNAESEEARHNIGIKFN